jgi:membrane-associated phospholipid phosphatase
MASRIVITAHFPSDVLVGAALGGGMAWAIRQGFARAGIALGAAAQPLPSPER